MKFRKTNHNFPKHTEISFSYLKYTGAVLRLTQMGRTFFDISFHLFPKTLHDTGNLLKCVSKRLPITVHAYTFLCVAFFENHSENLWHLCKTNWNSQKRTEISFSYLKFTGPVLRLTRSAIGWVGLGLADATIRRPDAASILSCGTFLSHNVLRVYTRFALCGCSESAPRRV